MSKSSMADKNDEDLGKAIGSLEESSGGDSDPAAEPSAPEPPGRSPNIERPKARKNVGIGAAPPPDEDNPNAPWPSNLAAETANEIARRFRKFQGLGDIHGIDAQVFPLDGSPYRMLGKVSFSELLAPDASPGDMLQTLITDRIHRRYATTDKTYEVNFVHRLNGSWMSKNRKLYLGSPAEIDRLSGVGEVRQEGPPPAYRPVPSGLGYAQPPSYAQPPAQAPQGSRNPEVDVLMDRVARTEGTLNEVLSFLREERQERRAAAGLPPAPLPVAAPGAPVPTASTSPGLGSVEDMVAKGIVRAFKELGAVPGVPPPAPASPNTAPPNPLVTEMESMLTGVLREAAGAVGKVVRDQMRTAIAGVGAPPPEPPEPIEPPEPEVAEPIPPPPFRMTDVGSRWPDGRPVMYATDDEGEMSLKGILLGNPIVMEAGLKVVDKLGDGAKDFLSKITLPNGTQVVGKTPRSAVDGTPRPGAQGVGEAPQSPNQPRPDPSPPPPPKRGFPAG